VHEWSLACELVRQAEQEASSRGAARILSVTARVGLLTGVVPELLNRSYEMARMGTLLEDAPLVVERQPVRARCPACGATNAFEEFGLVCPGCGALGLEVLEGDEIVLTRMELEIPDSPRSAEGEGHV
jgi:hydrogenase nickel incorporation protein HypA/HybF